jgi:hypothetical protein
LSALRTAALARAAADGAVACVGVGSAGLADDLLDDMQDLGAPTGYVVDLLADGDELAVSKLTDAGLVAVVSDSAAADVRAYLSGTVLDAVAHAFQNGAVVYLEGAAAEAFGDYLVEAEQLTSAFGWVLQALILATRDYPPEIDTVYLDQRPDGIVIEIGQQAALALGPDGELELWGSQRVRLALGAAYNQAHS